MNLDLFFTLLFLTAFLPPLVDDGRHGLPQLTELSITLLLLATFFNSIYAIVRGLLKKQLTSPLQCKIRNRLTGSLFIGTGLGLPLLRRDQAFP